MKKTKPCDSCNNDTNYNNPNLYVCKQCFNQDAKKLITKTDAIKEYALSADDLEDVRNINYKNAYRSITFLYLRSDIKRIAIEKYGSEEKLNEKIKSKNKRSDENKKIKEETVTKNREKLKNYFDQIGLKIRSDSKLCENYIKYGDKCGMTVEKIGQIMKEMEFFYNYTDYPNILKKNRYDSDDSDDDEETLRDDSKEEAIKKYIKENFSDTHKLMETIPLSLHHYIYSYKK